MLNVLDKTDTEIKTDVLSELKYDPSLKVTEIGVLVTDGIVTLNGYTTSFDEKLAAFKLRECKVSTGICVGINKCLRKTILTPQFDLDIGQRFP